jgi:hypothetical protein
VPRAGLLAHAGAADESLAVAMVFAALWIGWVGWSRLRGTGFPRLPRGAGVGLLALGASLLVASAIVTGALLGPSPSPSPVVSGAPSTSGPRPASTATLAIVTPADGATVAGDELEVVMELTGGRVVEGASTDLTPDEGHIHLTLDGEIVSMTYGTVQVIDLRTTAPGTHTLEAEFVAADHSPFSPRVTTSVTFTSGSDG